ncbi:MAG: phage holin family protein [Oligoflexales bacterium]
MLKVYLIHWLLATVTLAITAAIVPGFVVRNFIAAMFASLIIGLLNVIVWPILVVFTLPLTILTFGLFLFIVNAIVLKFGAALVPGFEIQGFFPAILGSIVLTLVGWFIKYLFYNS